MKPRHDQMQLTFDWTSQAVPQPASTLPIVKIQPRDEPETSLVQRLQWDFTTTFPLPTDDAVDTGVVDESDCEPENLKSMHECYASQCLGTLKALDAVMDARRRGIDPGNGKAPRSKGARERLSKYLAEEPARLERMFAVLIETYGNAFGDDAAAAFTKFLRARHAGIAVVAEGHGGEGGAATTIPSTKPRRLSSILPVPEPLRSSVAAGVFGHDEHGKPIRPGADEIRVITELHADRMTEMDDAGIRSAVAKYAADFGQPAADQLERHVRHRMECN